MRILLAMVVLVGLAACVHAATPPGTIVTTSASVTYSDSAGRQMPQETSNAENVLVVSSNPDRPVLLAVRALYFGPSTVGRTVKVVGTIFTNSSGAWLDDGSVLVEKDSTGKLVGRKLYCKVSTVFLTQGQMPAPSVRTVLTGISQVDADGTPIIIPSTDTDLRPLAP
jgi:hypothetical protein